MFTVPFVRNPYNYDMDDVSRETGLACDDPSKAVQDAAEDADINTIVRRFGLTGQLPDAVQAPRFEDFDAVYDYHTAMIAVTKAQDAFMQMPADVRARFGNDPQVFLKFVGEEGNRAEAEKLGLVVKPPGKLDVEPAKGD